MNKKNFDYIKALLRNSNYNFNEVRVSMGNNNPVFINSLMNLIDIELYTKSNPFYGKKMVINDDSKNKILKFLTASKKINNNHNYYIRDRELVNKIIEMIEKNLAENQIEKNENEVTKKKKPQKKDEYDSFIFDFIFIRRDIFLYKKIIEKYNHEFIMYLKDINNVRVLIERFIDEVKVQKNSAEMIATINILAYSLTHISLSETTKTNIIALVNAYYLKIDNSELNSDLKKYFELLNNSIGNFCNPKFIDCSSIAEKYQICRKFDRDLTKELNGYNKYAFSEDMTAIKTFTLDKTPTGSLEDAISLTELDNGSFNLTIYIIDPFAYIPKNGDLELEARSRVKNIYINGETITMFPETLAYTDLSLLKGENKKVIAHSFVFSKEMDLISFKSKPAVIKVDHNIRFSDFDKGVTELTDKEMELLIKVTAFIKNNYPIAGNYYNDKRTFFDAKNVKSLSEEVISNLKIFTNNMITKTHEKTDKPFIYMVSDQPFNLDQTTSFSQVKNFFADSSYYIGAQYSHINTGHKKLCINSYARVTTPVRNYAALVNQEFFKNNIIRKKTYLDSELYLLEEEVKAICKHMNEKTKLIDMFLKENLDNQKILRKSRC